MLYLEVFMVESWNETRIELFFPRSPRYQSTKSRGSRFPGRWSSGSVRAPRVGNRPFFCSRPAPALVFTFGVSRLSRNRTWHGHWNSRPSREDGPFKTRHSRSVLTIFPLGSRIKLRAREKNRRVEDLESKIERKKEKAVLSVARRGLARGIQLIRSDV